MRGSHRFVRVLLDHLQWLAVMVLPARMLSWHPLRRLQGEPMSSPEATVVMEAAAILEISEYDLLVLAYEERFGRRPARREIDRIFTPYMIAGKTPAWAVGTAHEIIDLFERDRLRDSRFAVRARPPTTRDIIVGLAQCVLLLLILWMIYVMFNNYPP